MIRHLRASLSAALVFSFVACSSAPPIAAPPLPAPQADVPTMTGKIQHVVILIQENRSFDNLFATFPGADGARHGKIHTGASVPLVEHDLLDLTDVPHGYQPYHDDYDDGKMDGFDAVATEYGHPALAPYQYVDPNQIAVYWTLAKRYVLADRMFMTAGSDSFIAHQDLIAGGTQINANDAIVDGATGGGVTGSANRPGCDAPAGTATSLITRTDRYLPEAGPFPCFGYATLRDLLDRKKITWRYYHTRPFDGWDAFEAIRSVRYSSEWNANVVDPQTKFFRNLVGGSLASVSWIVPTADFSDHPGVPHDYGPDWIGNVVNAIGKSKYWDSTAVFIVWDDWGGFYDHEAPQQFGFGQLGFRVPAIIVSPYARSGYIAHTQYEFGSILRFIEDNWQLGRLGTSDVRANSIAKVFDFSQKPRPFVPVRVNHSREFFFTLPLSKLPLDTE